MWTNDLDILTVGVISGYCKMLKITISQPGMCFLVTSTARVLRGNKQIFDLSYSWKRRLILR